MLLYEKAYWLVANTELPKRELVDALMSQYNTSYTVALDAFLWACDRFYSPYC